MERTDAYGDIMTTIARRKIQANLDASIEARRRYRDATRVFEALGDLFTQQGQEEHITKIRNLENLLEVPEEERFVINY